MAILKTTNSPIYQRWVGQKEQQAKAQPDQQNTQQPTTNEKTVSDNQNPNSPIQNDLSDLCRQAANLDKPECIKWFDDLSKNRSSVNSNGLVTQTVSYNSNKPYEFEYQPQVQPTDFPRMSGVMKLSSGKLIAVDQQGNYMQNISQEDCRKWLSGYRPFNYFAQQKQSTEGVSTTDSVNQTSQTSPL